jgi:hypothetical protein
MIGVIDTITDYIKGINVRDAMVCGFIIIYAAGSGYSYFKGQRDLKKYSREKAKEELEKKERLPGYNTLDHYVK